jgi:hypothetical protein
MRKVKQILSINWVLLKKDVMKGFTGLGFADIEADAGVLLKMIRSTVITTKPKNPHNSLLITKR